MHLELNGIGTHRTFHVLRALQTENFASQLCEPWLPPRRAKRRLIPFGVKDSGSNDSENESGQSETSVAPTFLSPEEMTEASLLNAAGSRLRLWCQINAIELGMRKRAAHR